MAKTWKDYFDYNGDYLPQHEGYFTSERTEQEVSFLLRNVLPPKKAKVLDLACGQGRHTIALIKEGYDVVGVDTSEQLLSMAYEDAHKQNVTATFVNQDMKRLDLDQQFDAIMILFCPFGIDPDSVNRQILQRVANHLKPGGSLFMELHNLFRFARRMHKAETATAVFDTKTLTLWDKTQGKLELPLRLYTVPELQERFEVVGLQLTTIWGGYDSSPYTFDSERLLVLAKRS